MTKQSRASSSSTASSTSTTTNTTKPKNATAPPPRPSASIVLLSPTNEVLLLHRVQTSTSFPSAHVFPGGNLSAFHEPALPSLDHPDHHRDSHPYRLAAIRETFEESGILLARPLDSPSSPSQQLSTLRNPDAARAARTAVHADKRRFTDWLSEDVRAAPLTEDLIPFTRWVTPLWNKAGRRFTTQMYLYLMPLSATIPSSSSSTTTVEVHQTPTSDGGLEHTAATFASAAEWLRRQERGEVVLFPPQCFLLTMVARALESAGPGADVAAQRRALVDFVTRAPSGATQNEEKGSVRVDGGGGKKVHPTAMIPWTEKVMSPEVLFVRKSDGRLVLGIDKPGPELKGSGRGGDFKRVVLAKFGKQGPTQVEVRNRDEVLREEKEAEARENSDVKTSSKI